VSPTRVERTLSYSVHMDWLDNPDAEPFDSGSDSKAVEGQDSPARVTMRHELKLMSCASVLA
jgi:hypothetical protein